MASSNDQNPTRSTRSGTGAGRLPSLRPIRDLSLGGGTTSVSSLAAAPPQQPGTRQKFTPNLAAAGRRQTPSAPGAASTANSSTSSGHRGREQQSDRGVRGGRGRGRGGRREQGIIQSKGIFSDGFAESEAVNNRSADFDGGGYFAKKRERLDESTERKPRSGVKAEAIKTDEDALKNLYKDDFIAHRSRSDRIVPVTLPLNPTSANSADQRMGDASMMDLDVDTEPAVRTALPGPMANILAHDANVALTMQSMPPAFQDLFGFTDDKSEQGALFFVQLPNIMADMLVRPNANIVQTNLEVAADVLVKAEFMDVDEHVPAQQPNDITIKTDPDAGTTITPADVPPRDAATQKRSQHTLADMPQGQIGKLLLMKSGRIRLKLNGTTPDKPLVFDAAPGTRAAFLQQVVSIQTPTHTEHGAIEQGRMCILGDVKHRLLFTPKIDNLLANLNRTPR